MRPAKTVDIITRTRSRGLLLTRAIGSVLEQTFADWRHIIVNDGGDPGLVEEIVGRYAERYRGRVTLIHNADSLGMEAASNAGIQAGSGHYIAIHDDDDSWDPGFLSSCVDALEKCQFDTVRGVVTHTTQIHETITDGRVVELRRQDYSPGLAGISIPQIVEINQFLPVAFMFERSVLEVIGLFDESLPVIGDWEFNVRFLMKYDVIVLQENLANYHVRHDAVDNLPNSVTAEPAKHLFYRSLIVNKHVRSDIESGRITSGMLLASGDHFHRMGSALFRLDVLLDKLKGLRFIVGLRRILRL